MKKSQYWTVKCTHAAAAYNDVDEYTLLNGDGDKIATFCGGGGNDNRGKLILVANQHNFCFLDEEAES